MQVLVVPINPWSGYYILLMRKVLIKDCSKKSDAIHFQFQSLYNLKSLEETFQTGQGNLKLCKERLVLPGQGKLSKFDIHVWSMGGVVLEWTFDSFNSLFKLSEWIVKGLPQYI